MYSRILVAVFLVLTSHLKSQDGYSKQQLLGVLKTAADDTTLINVYNELTWPVYSYDLPDSSLYYGEKAVHLAKKNNDLRRLSIAYRRMGITYLNLGDIKKALANEEASYHLSEKINFKKGMYMALNNIGVAYLNNELLNKALGYFLKSLSILEQTKDYATMVNVYSNCGSIYGRIFDQKKSKEYYSKALHYAKLLDNKNLLILSNCNVSAAFRNLNEMDSAAFYLDQAAKYLSDDASTETKLKYHLNVGLLHSYRKENREALESFLKTIPYITNPSNAVTLYINIADEYSFAGNHGKALEYYKLAFDISKKNKMYSNLEYTSYEIAKIYKGKKEWEKFADLVKLHLNYKDSNTRINAVQQIQKQQLEFDYQRKQIADSIKFEQREHLKTAQLEVANAQLSTQRSFGIMLIAVLAAIIFVCVFIFNRFVVIRRQKKIIEMQKQIMDVKNQEVLDSINYARRLQRAILPLVEDIKAELDFDLLYLPKDIIGGDFYFFEKYRDHVFLGICDCTGHGIPGAIMSVVCSHSLQKSIREFHLTDPSEILFKCRELIIESLNASQHNIKDGMDCSLIVIEKTTGKISWAGANNPLWIIDNEQNLLEIKADKQPVAFYEHTKPFTTHALNVKAGSVLYLLTDGYADQFGGLSGKKFKNKSLKNLLISLHKLPVDQQVEKLQQHFVTWKNNLDQVDDVAIAAVRFG